MTRQSSEIQTLTKHKSLDTQSAQEWLLFFKKTYLKQAVYFEFEMKHFSQFIADYWQLALPFVMVSNFGNF